MSRNIEKIISNFIEDGYTNSTDCYHNSDTGLEKEVHRLKETVSKLLALLLTNKILTKDNIINICDTSPDVIRALTGKEWYEYWFDKPM